MGLWVSGSNMRPWRGGCFSHLRYARHVSIASIICMATAPVFGPSFESFSLRAILFFFQSVSQSTTTAITTATTTATTTVVPQPLLQSLQFRDLSANQSSNRLITTAIITATATFQRSLDRPIIRSINQSRRPTAITYQGLLSADLWLGIDAFLNLLPANLSLESHRIARPVANTLLGLSSAYLSLEINALLGLFASSFLEGD